VEISPPAAVARHQTLTILYGRDAFIALFSFIMDVAGEKSRGIWIKLASGNNYKLSLPCHLEPLMHLPGMVSKKQHSPFRSKVGEN
jgi:hypothetical protein